MKRLVAAMLITIVAAPVAAQQWQWPDKPKNLYEGRGNIQAAMENHEQAIKLNPKDERLQKQLERLQAKETRR